MQERRDAIVLSLGAGWGSVGMSLMLEHGLLEGFEKPEVSVFADTQAEPPHVYETLDWLESRISWPIIRASLGNLKDITWKQIRREAVPERGHHETGRSVTDIPLFGSNGGMTKRQCTTAFKIDVIKREFRSWFGLNPPYLQVYQYLGISLDEAGRMKQAKEKYLHNVYPLIDCRVSRADIMAWMNQEYPAAPVGRSACYFCPFHSIQEWQEIRKRYPNLYEDACQIERAMIARDNGPFYLYNGRYGLGLEKAMAQADLQGTLEIEPDQFQNECEGLCGV